MTTIALLADIHLPDRDDTVKELVWDWALAEARRQGADLLVGLGDLTSIGSLLAAQRLRRKLDATGLPCLLSPGNAELRSRAVTAAVLRTLASPRQHGEVLILESAKGFLDAASRDALTAAAQAGRRQLLVATHCPPGDLPANDRALLEALMAEGVIGCLAVGHKHWDLNGGACEQIRGLDPDKAQGGPPALVIMQREEHGWRRRDLPCPLADPRTWPEDERRDWLDHLGISGMKRSLEALAEASSEGVAAFELRYESMRDIPEDELRCALASWRQHGGKTLSLHCPSMGWRDGVLQGVSELNEAVACAGRLGAQRVTVHVPAVPLPTMRKRPEVYAALLSGTCDCLRPLAAAGIAIGVENMHMTAHDHVGNDRGFGYIPSECQEWITALRGELGVSAVGFHLDIGHARNNNWYASLYNISEWYAEMGGWMNGCHLHQYCQVDGRYGNHYPLLDLFGGYMSLSSLFMSWRLGQFRHVPMFLEIRGEPSIGSYCALRDALGLTRR